MEKRKKEMRSDFGKILRSLRTAKHMTQDELSDKLGLKRPTYTYYECGKSMPDLYMLAKIARFFDVPMEYFLPPFEDDKEKEYF